MEIIEVIFPAILKIDQFSDQDVRLSGGYPEIQILNANQSSGLHHFIIRKSIANFHPSMLEPTIEEASRQIEHFWNILAFVRDTNIITTGEIFYKIKGQTSSNLFNSVFTNLTGIGSLTANGITKANKEWFEGKKEEFHTDLNYDLLHQWNFIRKIEEPVSRFISTYTLLLSLNGDNQNELDKIFIALDNNIEQVKSPHKSNSFETIFTRLRNELSHDRKGVSIFVTHGQVAANIKRFDSFAKLILEKHIKKT